MNGAANLSSYRKRLDLLTRDDAGNVIVGKFSACIVPA